MDRRGRKGQANVGRHGQGGGGQKSLKISGHPLWMAPIQLRENSGNFILKSL